MHHVLGVSIAPGQPPGAVERSIEVRQDDLLKSLPRHRLLNGPAGRQVYSRVASRRPEEYLQPILGLYE
jgi:hypothetical protein